jgi:hypothetical protein
LSTLTGTQVLLLVVSETGLVYTFTTPKLQPLVTKPEGKNLIQTCLNAPDIPSASAEPPSPVKYPFCFVRARFSYIFFVYSCPFNLYRRQQPRSSASQAAPPAQYSEPTAQVDNSGDGLYNDERKVSEYNVIKSGGKRGTRSNERWSGVLFSSLIHNFLSSDT